MTDAEYNMIMARIDALFEEWIAPFGLRAQWTIKRRYWRNVDAYLAHDTDGADPLHRGAVSTAHTHADWAYLTATICFNCHACIDHLDTLETMFVHECAHILVHEMRAGTRCDCEYDMRHEERVCTILAQAFLWTKAHFLAQGHERFDATDIEHEGMT